MMLDITATKKNFEKLNIELKERNIVGEISACGGRVIVLCYFTKKATNDVKEIFQPTKLLRKAWSNVETEYGLDDHVKLLFHPDPPREDIFYLSHLRVFAPFPDYLLAMKCAIPFLDSSDFNDIEFLIQYLKINCHEKLIERISKYYPHGKLSSRTKTLMKKINFLPSV